MGLLLISYPAYLYLRSHFPLPSRQVLMYFSFIGLLKNEYDFITNTTKIGSIVKNYRKSENISNLEVIDVVLAVDAVSFDPLVSIDKKSFVYGLKKNKKLLNEEIDILEKNFTKFEEFFKENKNVVITDAFVFQAQHLISEYHSFVVHVHPSTQGKGTETEVELMANITQILSENKIKVASYAFDGDTIYKKLHDNLYNHYSSILKSDLTFLNFSDLNQLLMISDPLHLLKRARYRILSSNVHLGITPNTDILNIEELKEIFKYPSLVYDNSKVTKMHDSLATQIFSFNSLKKQIEHKKSNYLSFFLPLCLMNIAISEKELTTLERINLLEISFYYCMILKEENNIKIKLLPQKKSKKIKISDCLILIF